MEFLLSLTCSKRWIPRGVHLDSAQPLCLTSILVVSLGSMRYLKQIFKFFFLIGQGGCSFVNCAKSLQSCSALCNPMDYHRPGFSVHGFSRQEYWSGLPVPSPGDLPDPEIEPESLALQADYLQSESPGKPITSLELQRQMIDALIVQLLAMLLANANLWLTQGRLYSRPL